MPETTHQDAQETADVGTQRVARVYAEALLNAAAKQNQAQEVLEELQALVGDVFKANPLIETFLTSRAIGRDRKAQVVKQSFEPRVSETLANFLNVLNKHDRLDLLRPIRGAYRELFDQRAGRILVSVSSATPLPDDQRDRLLREIKEAFQREPILDLALDPDLLGGLVVQVGDWRYDASVKTQLDNLRNQLIESSSHEIQSRRDRFRSGNGD